MRACLVMVGLGLAGLTACYDFEGDLGNIGFRSNLMVGHEGWNPGYGIASGTEAAFYAAELIGDEDADFVATGSLVSDDLDVTLDEGKTLAIYGSTGTGVVKYRGTRRDRFDVRYATPQSAALHHRNGVHDRVGVALHSEVDGFLVQLRDRDGSLLGYNADDIDLVPDGRVSIWGTSSGHVLSTAGNPGGVTLHHLGIELGYVDVVAVDPSDVVALEVHGVFHGDTLRVAATGRTADGLAVYGLPVSWSWPAEHAALDGEDHSTVAHDVLLLELPEGTHRLMIEAQLDDAGIAATATVSRP